MRRCVAILVSALTALASAHPSELSAGHAQHFKVHARVPAQVDLDNYMGLSASPIPTAPNPTVSTLISSSSSPSTNQLSSTASSDLTSTSSSAASAPSQTSNSSALNDLNTIHIRRLPFIIASVNSPSELLSWFSTLGSNGQWPASEIDYTTGCNAQRANWPAEVHWTRIATMSAAFHGGLAGADQWVGDTELLNAIRSAMDFWFGNDFTNNACLDQGGLPACPCGTPGFWNTNWFSNIIGIPELVGQSCLLLNDSLTPSELSNCTNVSGRAYGTISRSINGVGFLTGANTLDVASIGIDLALLTANVSLLQDAYDRVHREVVVQPAVRADGIRPDGSFGQHDGIIYNGNYGKDYTNDVLALEIEAGGTQFQAGEQSMTAFESLIDGDQWMIYRNVITGILHWDFSVLGRFISFPVVDNQATGSIKVNLTEVRVLGEEWRSQTLTDVYKSLSTNTTDANIGSIFGNRVFYNNDYVVHRGTGYVTTLRMYSTRTQNTECTNSQNPFGFHLSDGTLYTYLTGAEYEDIAAAWDWNLIPGTTVDYNGTPLDCGDTDADGIEDFVGGVSTGNLGLAAMRYRNPLTGALEWQKAWAFVEGDVQHVMVNNITQEFNASGMPPVFSVLDQRTHNGDVWVDGSQISQGGNFSSARSLWHAGVGYLFHESEYPPSQLSVDFGNRTGNWSTIGISKQPPPTIDLFSAWLVHSLNATVNEQSNTSSSTVNLNSLSYTIFPATSSYADFAEKSRKRRTRGLVEVRNDAHISALEHHRSTEVRTAYIVFWDSQGGEVELTFEKDSGRLRRRDEENVVISSDIGLLAIVDEKNSGEWCVTVAEPTQMASNASVTVKFGEGEGHNQALFFDLPQGGMAGSSVSQS
ncbi:hypothetical protein SCHPADRAFT_842659, partial [Schizopora paradoxa]